MTTSILAVVLKKTIGDTVESASTLGAGLPLDKAQLRRSQVRKAQIQHRQRKANYVKQLELDVARIRDLITDAQREAQRLKLENEAMKASVRPCRLGLDDITMTLDFDDVMNAPSFRISSSPSDSQYESSNQSLCPVMPDTTPDQTQEAINFILA